jgi:HlyD family secretion protein
VFATRRITRQGLKAQLTERIGQLTEEIRGLQGQQNSYTVQLGVARTELADLRGLESRRLVQRPRITALEREIARNEGMLEETASRALSAKGKIVETQLQIMQLENDHMSEISKELREAETRINELNERLVAAEDQLRRVEIRAPITGVVHQLNVHTVGGVVGQTEPLMLIVPESDRLILEVRIQPQDIDQVHIGQEARVRFTAFNQRTTPELTGKVFRIGADLTRETQTGQTYFLGGISIEEDERAKLQGLQLLPGMPADAFIRTGARTFASYISKPLVDQMSRAMRER